MRSGQGLSDAVATPASDRPPLMRWGPEVWVGEVEFPRATCVNFGL